MGMPVQLKNLILLVAFLLLVVPALLAGVVICPACGYENPDSAATCSHCAATLPPVARTPDPAAAPADAAKDKYLDPDVVRNEVRLGRDLFEKGEPLVALHCFRNAMALDTLTDPKTGTSGGEPVAEWIAKCERGIKFSTGTCPMCNGTGKGRMKIVSLKGEESSIEVPGRSCERCTGTGKVDRRGNVDESKGRVAAAARSYATQQQGRKYVAVGGAWIPVELEAGLTARQTSLLKRAVPPACPDCLGIGLANCAKCKGAGELKCSNTKCVNGVVTVEKLTGLSKAKMTQSEKCKVCGGDGMMECPDCAGNGAVPCKTCGGTGERKSCDACGGKGLLACKVCLGTGQAKGVVCAACRGEGDTLCNACKGDGRKR